MVRVGHWWQRNIVEPGKLPLLLSLVAFVLTFVITRTITRAIPVALGIALALARLATRTGDHGSTSFPLRPDWIS